MIEFKPNEGQLIITCTTSTGNEVAIVLSEIAAVCKAETHCSVFMKGMGGFAFILPRSDYDDVKMLMYEYNRIAYFIPKN